MRTGVFVLGMHRSGTSATTRLINLLGVPINVESDWMAPAPDNPTGYWESEALRHFNDEILAVLGGDTEHPPDMPKGWETAPRLDSFYARAPQLFDELFPTEQWLWKDPRLCLTFPFWRRAIDARPVIVLAYRNPLEVARSYAKRNELSIDHGLALWERYVVHSLREIHGLPTYVTAYDAMIADAPAWCERMREFLTHHGVATGPPRDLGAELDDFLDPGLRHSAHTLADLREHRHGARLHDLVAFLAEAEGPHAEFAPPAEICVESGETTDLLAHLPARASLRVIEPRQVSVVVPMLDHGEHLDDTLASIAGQSRPPLEVIIVEGEMDRGAAAVAERSAVESALILQAPGGRSAARNTGVTVSRGGLVLMVEAGDVLPDGFIEGAVQLLDDSLAISFVYCDQQDVGDDDGLHSWPAFDLYELTERNRVGAVALFRRQLWDDTFGYGPLDALEDWDFWLACGETGATGARLDGAAARHRVVRRSPRQERRLMARLMLNHPRLYTAEQLVWAQDALDGAGAGEDELDVVVTGRRGQAPLWAGRRLPQLRSQALLVMAEELVEEPRLSEPLRKISATADVTVILAGATDPAGKLVSGLERSLVESGLAGPEGPHMLVAPLSTAQLSQQADAILTLGAAPIGYSGLPRLDPETMVARRMAARAAV